MATSERLQEERYNQLEKEFVVRLIRFAAEEVYCLGFEFDCMTFKRVADDIEQEINRNPAPEVIGKEIG